MTMPTIEPGPSQHRKRVREAGEGPRKAPTGTPTRRWSASAWIMLALLAPIAAFIAWHVLTLGVADLWVDSEPETTLSWRSADSDALVDAADDALAQPDFAKAKTLALRALATYPLDGRPYRELAGIAEFFGKKQEAHRLYLIALRNVPRDIPTRAKLLDYDLQAGKLPEALHQIDMELRIQPPAASYLLPALAALSQNPLVLEPLSRLLKTRPPWRAYFLTVLAASGSDSDMVDRVFASRGGDDPLPFPKGATEADLLIQRQIKDGRWSNAYVTWAATLSDAQRTVLGDIYDGSFTFQPGGHAFDWSLPDRGTGFDMLIAPRAGSTTDNVLQVKFDGLPLDYQPIRQRLILGPGHYRLTGMGQSNALTSENGLHWTVACTAGSRQNIIAASQPFAGDIAWGVFQMEFDVPDADCGSQWLKLDLAPGSFKGQPLTGTAIFDNLAMTRLGDAADPAAAGQFRQVTQ